METASPLKAYRDQTGLTLEQLGDRLGVNKTTVMRWEAGAISAKRAVMVERELGIPRWTLRPDLWSDPAAPPAKPEAA